MWVVWIVLVIMFVVGLWLASLDTTELLGMMICFISGLILLLTVIQWPLTYYATLAQIERYYALKDTIEVARSQGIDDIERAALTHKIVENNTTLAEYKYWNQFFLLDMYCPDEVMNLEPLK